MTDTQSEPSRNCSSCGAAIAPKLRGSFSKAADTQKWAAPGMMIRRDANPACTKRGIESSGLNQGVDQIVALAMDQQEVHLLTIWS